MRYVSSTMLRYLWIPAAALLLGAAPPPSHAPATPTDFPATESTLSLLEPSGSKCVWSRLDPVSQARRTLAAFAGDCRGARVALSADGKQGGVWFAPSQGTPRLFAVDLGSGETSSLPVPGGLEDFGFDPQGRKIALTLQKLTAAEIEKGEARVDGRPVKLARDGEGIPVLVHAWVYSGGAWKQIETANSTTGWDYGLGVRALETAQHLAFRSAEVLVNRVQGDGEIDSEILAGLARFAPQAKPGDSSGWIRFGSGDTWLEIWEESGEFAYATGLAAFLDPERKPVKPPGWPFGEKDLVSYTWSGPFLLVAEADHGAKPRLYRSGKLLWSSDSARTVTFWPRRKDR